MIDRFWTSPSLLWQAIRLAALPDTIFGLLLVWLFIDDIGESFGAFVLDYIKGGNDAR